MLKKYKRYIVSIVYRGYTVELRCTANSYKEAAEKLGVSTHFMRGYALRSNVDEPIPEIMAEINSGYIVFDPFNRKDLIRKLLPWSELKLIIDDYSKKYSEIRLKNLRNNDNKNS